MTKEPATKASLLVTAGFFFATFLLTRQSHMPALAGLAAPFALSFVLLRLRPQVPALALVPIFAYGLCSGLASIVAGREVSDVFRFFAITMGTLFAFHIRPTTVSVSWSLLPVTLQALLVAAISIGLSMLQDADLAFAARSIAQEAQWGDIYSFDGLYYRVQVVGNALLPLLFMVSLWHLGSGRVYRWLVLASLIGLVAAGNLTYTLVAALAAFIRYRAWLFATPGRATLTLLSLLVALVLAGGAVAEAFSVKFDGGDSSMGVRFDQIDAAAREVGDSPARMLWGTGLGAPFPDGRERKYSESQYIELQSLYLFLQLGAVGTLLYLATLFYCARRFLADDGRTIFWLFLLAGSTNPYILDTNQLVATALLVCVFPRRETVGHRSRSLEWRPLPDAIGP